MARIDATIPFLKGFPVKPAQLLSNGTVLFTDETTTIIRPNQLQCEAYGYTYNKASGTCSAFRYTSNLSTAFSDLSNSISGA